MKRVLITGASSGIGFYTAKRFLTEGYIVIAQYSKNQKGISELVDFANLNGMGERLFVFKGDFCTVYGIKDFIQEVIKSFKRIDVLVNNAGVGYYGLFTQTTNDDLDKVININQKAPFLITQAVAPSMISQQQGKIIFVSSMWGMVGASMESAYSASKASLIGLTKSLAKELAPSNINVNCVCPGVIDTPMNARFTKEDMQELINSTPLGKIGKPEDIANLIYFLASEQSEFITGQVITADGGFSL